MFIHRYIRNKNNYGPDMWCIWYGIPPYMAVKSLCFFYQVYNYEMVKKQSSLSPIFARILIGIVTFLNLQAAIYFIFTPDKYAPGFELTGLPGNAMVQGMGLLFVMWNIPYIVALINPLRHFVSLIEAVIMQGIGVLGETALLLTLIGEHPQIHASVLRFILFDGGGLVLLLTALMLMVLYKRSFKKII